MLTRGLLNIVSVLGFCQPYNNIVTGTVYFELFILKLCRLVVRSIGYGQTDVRKRGSYTVLCNYLGRPMFQNVFRVHLIHSLQCQRECF